MNRSASGSSVAAKNKTPSKRSPRARQSKNTLALSVHTGLLEGAFFPLSRKKNIIGRHIQAHIPIKDSKVSREHASIVTDRGMFFISDMGSTNGTYVNNERIVGKKLISVGDNIRIGSYTFKVEHYTPKETSPNDHRWASETKILFRDSTMVAPTEKSKRKTSAKKRSESASGRASKEDLFSPLDELMKTSTVKAIGGMDAEKIKWLLLAAGVLLVLAASFTRVSHFS